jgi:tRNA (uracil-5-)-methyltransferase TRM9
MEVYNIIAEHFDETRYSLWEGVKSFLTNLSSNSYILDVGCGNGKYLSVRKDDCYIYACDPCEKFVNIAKNKHPHAEVIVANGLSLPYLDNSFDVVISIAVMHHLDTEYKRIQFLKEIKRVLKKDGKALITVWATTSVKNKWIKLNNKNDYNVPWHMKNGDIYYRYYHLFEKDEIIRLTGSIPMFEKDNWFFII